MSASFMNAASRRIGNLRIGRRPIPGQGRFTDAIGKVASWMGGGRGVSAPWPGVKFEVDLNDRIQRQMWAGSYEPHVRKCFDALLEPGDVYIDVGGHIGFHAVFAAYRTGPQGHVFAFEADPSIYERLARNLSQFPSARAVNAAAWDHSGSLTFERSSVKSESGWGTVSAVRDFGAGEHVEIPSLALDDFIRDVRLERWDSMKLDAEGSELAVLRGAESSLMKFRPSLILEVNTILLEESGMSTSGVSEFLLQRRYRIFWLEYRRLLPWNPAQIRDFSEALCVPEEHLDKILPRLASAGFEQAG